MKPPALDDHFALHFDWPEPLIIDAICDAYSDVLDATQRMAIARLQAKSLRGIYEGAEKKSTGSRLELIGQCAALGISSERIAQADRAVFLELTKLIAARFRTSPRNRTVYGQSLREALDRLVTGRPLPSKRVRRSPAAAYAH